jgi:hypothetical protein
MTMRQADPFVLGGAVALALVTIVLAQIGWVGPQVALIGNMIAVGVVFIRRATVQRWLRPHGARGASTGARRVTEVVTERS